MSKTKDVKPGQQAANPGEEHITLLPSSAPVGSADFTLVVTGFDSTFNANSNIIFGGLNTATTLVDASHVSTVIAPSKVTQTGSVDVWVWTDGTHDTDAAFFSFTPSSGGGSPQPMTPDDVLTQQLKSWGISGEPTSWAPNRWQSTIVAIRFANTGFGTEATVQGLLDSTFPLNKLKASDVCLSGVPSAVKIRSKRSGDRMGVSIPDLGLPPENVTWLDDQGLVVGHGNDLDVPDGTAFVVLQLAVGGEVTEERFDVAQPKESLMRAVPAYPPGVATGGCFITGRYEVGVNERVLDLEVEIDNLPPFGRLCLCEPILRGMVTEMGWRLVTPELQAEHDDLVVELAETHEQLAELMAAMAGIVNLPMVEHAMSVAARKVAGKESVHEWIDSLPKAERR